LRILTRLAYIIRSLWFTGLILVCTGCLAGVFAVFYTARDLPKLPSPLSRIIETPQTMIFASNGQVLLTLGERKAVPLSMVSKHFINAILAVEDHRFFEHHGINILRTAKGLYITLFKKGKVQGASTITQQLAKNLFFSFKKSYTRKFKELLIALQMEASNSKQEILQAYINQIYFGAGAQGIEKASQIYFGKSAIDLTLPEAALLAGLPKSPTNYNPFRHYDLALKRRAIVLKRMVSVGFISRTEAQKAMASKPDLNRMNPESEKTDYFTDAVLARLIKKYGQEVVFHGGIKVFTTLDTRLEAIARTTLKKGLERLDSMMGIKGDDEDRPQGALVAIDTGSGAVKALVGGRQYSQTTFNRAVNSRRQPGSGFKPFLYYTALKDPGGLNPATPMTDKPVIIHIKGGKDWAPENFSRTYSGTMILKKALFRSVNTIAAQLMEKTGPESVIETARACGITSPLQPVYSLALGSCTVTPLEMASAYTVFANMGIRHRPFMIWRVEDALGRVLFEHIVQDKRVLDAATCFQVVDMMKAVIDTGSGRSVRRLGFDRPAAGKTGTTDNFRDAWFTGFTPGLCTSVWTGFDRKKSLIAANGAGITGGRGAAPIWTHFMMEALKSEPVRDFAIPDNIRFEKVDAATGCLPDPAQADAQIMEVALKPDQHPCPPQEQPEPER